MNQIGNDGYCPHCRAQNQPQMIAHHLRPGTILNGKYLVGKALGEGGFGITYIGRDLTLDIKVAIKEYYPSGYVNRNNTVNNIITPSAEKQRAVFQKGKERFLQEARSLAKFSDEKGVVFVRDYFESCGSAYIVMEFLDGVTLQEYLRRNGTIDAETAFRMMLPIISSLERMHSAGIIHRDISPDNIMFMHDGSLKLMDFGSARFFTNDEKEMSVLVKQGYAPEEQYRRNGSQGPWTDVYGLCATIYKCITGVVPEDSLNRAHYDTLKRPSELGVGISAQMETTLMYGLAVYQDDRCRNMTELKKLVTDALAHRQNAFVPPQQIYQRQQMNQNDPYRTQAAYDQNMTPGNDQRLTYGDGYYNKQVDQTNFGYQQTGNTAKKKNSSVSAVLIVIVIALLALVGFLIYMLFKPNPTPKPDDDSSQESSETAVQTGDDTTEGEESEESDVGDDNDKTTVKVPDVVGMSLDAAKRVLESVELDYDVHYQESSKDKDEVIDQSPKSGESKEVGTKIALIVSEGPTEAPTAKTEVRDPAEVEAEGTSRDYSEGKTLYCRFEGNVDSMSLFSRATAYSKTLDDVYCNDSVSYIKTVYDFYYVNFNGQKGYVRKKYFKTSSAASLEKWDGGFAPGQSLFSYADGLLHLRKSASFTADSLAEIPAHGHLKLIKIRAATVTYDGKEYIFDEVEYNGQKGYVPDDCIKDDFAADLEKKVPIL